MFHISCNIFQAMYFVGVRRALDKIDRGQCGLLMGLLTGHISIVKSMKKANFTGERFQNFYTQCVTSVACSIHFTGSMSQKYYV